MGVIINNSKDMWNILSDYGLDVRSLTTLKLYMWTLVILIQQIQIVVFIVINWDDVDLRYQGMEDFECCLFICIFLFQFCVFPHHLVSTLKLIDQEYFDYGIYSSDEKRKLLSNSVHDRRRHSVIVCYSILLFQFLLVVPPISGGVHATLTKSADETVSYEAALPMDSWFPFEIDLKMYIILCIFNLVFIAVVYRWISFYLCSTLYALNCMSTNIRYLNLSLAEIDTVLNYKKDDSVNDQEMDASLKIYLRQMVTHHNIICKNLETVNQTSLHCSLNVTQFVCLCGCITLYRFFETTDIFEKVHFAFSMLFMTGETFGISYNGQVISNESENLRNAMYGCSWMDKPLWFKKSLLQMMIRANKHLEVRPLGLYVLNLSSFTSIMNAAYAYCNFLRTARDKL